MTDRKRQDLLDEIDEIRRVLREQGHKRLSCRLLLESVAGLVEDLRTTDSHVRARLTHLHAAIARTDVTWKETTNTDSSAVISSKSENTEAIREPVLIMHLTNGGTFTIPDPVRILHHASGEVMGWSAAPQIVTDVIREQLSRGHRSGAVSTESSDYSWNLLLSPAPKTGS